MSEVEQGNGLPAEAEDQAEDIAATDGEQTPEQAHQTMDRPWRVTDYDEGGIVIIGNKERSSHVLIRNSGELRDLVGIGGAIADDHFREFIRGTGLPVAALSAKWMTRSDEEYEKLMDEASNSHFHFIVFGGGKLGTYSDTDAAIASLKADTKSNTADTSFDPDFEQTLREKLDAYYASTTDEERSRLCSSLFGLCLTGVRHAAIWLTDDESRMICALALSLMAHTSDTDSLVGMFLTTLSSKAAGSDGTRCIFLPKRLLDQHGSTLEERRESVLSGTPEEVREELSGALTDGLTAWDEYAKAA